MLQFGLIFRLCEVLHNKHVGIKLKEWILS